MGKSAPPAPDYTGAAREQGASNERLLEQQTVANRPNVNTPWGSQTWTRNGDQWTTDIRLTPDQQRALDAQTAIQEGRSAAANQLLNQATESFQRPFSWGDMPTRASSVQAPDLNQNQMAMNPDMPNTRGPRSAPLVRGAQQMGMQFDAPMTQMQLDVPGQQYQNSIQSPELQTDVQGAQIRSSVPNTQIQNSIENTQVRQSMDRTAGDWRERAQQAALDFQRPLFNQQRSDLESQLANQGLTRGSEAWNREIQRMEDSQARQQLQAFDSGRAEANMLFNQDLQASQFQNQAAGQQFNQNVTQGQFANQAAGQQFSQGLAQGQFENQAAQQLFNQNLSQGQFRNQAAGQQFQQNMGQANLFNDAASRQFQQGLAQGQFRNQALGQQFNQGIQQGQFRNQAQNQWFDQSSRNAQLNNAAAGQDFQQRMASRQFENQAAQQLFQNQMALGNRDDARAQQQLAMQMQAGQFNQGLRQQAIAEEQMRRGMTLNELNALLTGQQVQMPNMPSTNQAGRGQATDMVGAMGNQYSALMDQFNARQANTNQAIGTGLSLAAMYFSDRRLKEDIQYTGYSIGGVPVVYYRYVGGHRRLIGVIAQDVLAVRPELVGVHPSGYLMVDYQGLLA